MPSFTAPDGRTKYVPGVYSTIEVQSSLVGPDPDFLVPVIIGQADQGHPYDRSGSLQANDVNGLAVQSPFVFCGTESACARYFGPDSEVTTAMRYAKRHGLPGAYVMCASDLVRASIEAASSGPTDEALVYSRVWGVIGSYIKIAAPSGTSLEVTPVERFSLLTQDAGASDTRIYVKDSSWCSPGMVIELGSNSTSNTAVTVKSAGTELDANGQIVHYIELVAAAGLAATTANYGAVALYSKRVLSSGTVTTGQELVDWINEESEVLGAEKLGTFTDSAWIAVATATPIKDISGWGAKQDGASPAVVAGDHTQIISDLEASEWESFGLTYGVFPQAYLILSESSTIHGSWRDYAASERARGFPISVTTGVGWGDTDLTAGDDTDPGYRATVLNSQDVMLAACGLDRLDAYLSLAPAIFGRRIEGGVGHNLTNDPLIYSRLEVQWNEIGLGELTTLHREGVATVRLSTSPPIRYVVSQGISTLQSNGSAWNEDTSTTPLVMQRDLGDYVSRAIVGDLDGRQLGVDEVTRESLAAVVLGRIRREEKRGRLIPNSGAIDSITLNNTGTGWDVAWSGRLPVTADYIGVTTRIQIGEE